MPIMDNNDLKKYSGILNDILNFKTKSIASIEDKVEPNLGDVTNAPKLLKFLKLNTKNKSLKDKCDKVYEIINSTTTTTTTTPSAPS